MKEFFQEDVIGYFSDGLVSVTKSDFVSAPVTSVRLCRNEELDLIFELNSRGWSLENPGRFPAGTVRRAEEVIEFRHAAGWSGIARGVVERNTHSSSKAGREPETLQTYSAHSVELNFHRKLQPSYVIEWISNVPDGYVWSEPVNFNVVEKSMKTVGSGNAEICMTMISKSEGGTRALHLSVSGFDLYVMTSIDQDKSEKNLGQIVYRRCPDQAFRDKIRTCLSFVLGRPIVYLGHTEYCGEWVPTFMRSVDALTVGGAVFKLYDLPPYPISDPKFKNIIDQKIVCDLVNALFEKFDAIKFNDLAWSYWYAVCAPLHAAAIHFGSLIEQLQNNSSRSMRTRGTLLDDEAWNSLNEVIVQHLKTANIEPGLQPILEGKISSLNQAPQSLILKRLLDTIGLRMDDVEMKAWKHRNRAAHGGVSDDPVELILNNKILRLLFHRMLAGITRCSDRYIDYYSLGHPVRELTEAIPAH
jgi:hypothetical protein